jgi:excisionase family DNA binding protein
VGKARQFLTVKAAAETLDLGQSTLRKWILHGKISTNRFGRSVRIPVTEIDRLIDEGHRPHA